MTLPIVSIPPVVNKYLEAYRSFFTKPQFNHFKHLVTGHIVCENTTLQEINDSFGDCEQSNLNRFVSHSSWDMDSLNSLRIQQVKDNVSFNKNGILIIDESLLHKSGRHMELAGAHRSGITKCIEWGHMAVNALYTDTEHNTFPVSTKVYVREKDCEKNNVIFKTKRELGIEQLDLALREGLPVKLVLADAGYEGEEFTREIKDRGLDFIIGVRISTNISIDRKERTSIEEYLSTITDADFKILIHKDGTYFYHIVPASIRGIGIIKLIISYKYGNEEDSVRCSITNLEECDENIIKLSVKRWEIECFHRDAKQHLGLEAYQVRLGRGMQIVALAILVAYTLVFLIKRILKTPIRTLKTVGETCRYLQLIAYKGIRWISCLIRKPLEFIETLKKHVFVKNTKV